MTQTPLIGVREAAAQAGVSIHIIKRDTLKGKLRPALKAPGRTGAYLFRPADVAAWVKGRAA